MTDYLSKDEIRQVACPACKAPPGEVCIHTGKGAVKKMRNGVNHRERMELAQAKGTPNLIVIDDEDDPATWEFAPAPARKAPEPQRSPLAGPVITRAYGHMQGVAGHLCLIMETRRGIRLHDIEYSVAALRKAADELEALLPSDSVGF